MMNVSIVPSKPMADHIYYMPNYEKHSVEFSHFRLCSRAPLCRCFWLSFRLSWTQIKSLFVVEHEAPNQILLIGCEWLFYFNENNRRNGRRARVHISFAQCNYTSIVFPLDKIADKSSPFLCLISLCLPSFVPAALSDLFKVHCIFKRNWKIYFVQHEKRWCNGKSEKPNRFSSCCQFICSSLSLCQSTLYRIHYTNTHTLYLPLPRHW